MTEDEDVVLMRIVGLINGGRTQYDGQYIVEYDPNRDGVEPGSGRPMLCYLRTTPSEAEATRFSKMQALELWRAIDERNPVRADGKPNRPLTSFSVAIGPVGNV